MGCNCKGVRNIEKLFNNNNNTVVDKRSYKYYVLKISDLFLSALNRIITIMLMLVLVPVIIIILIGGYIFSGVLQIKVPLKYKKLITDYYGEKLQNQHEHNEGQTS